MLPFTPSTRPQEKRNRTPALIALSICTFFLFAVIFAQATFKLTFLQPDTSEETLIFAAVSALIFLLFVALTFVLLRTLLRLYAERKTGVLGSKFRSRMVLGALLLSLGPVIFLFLFSYGLINRSKPAGLGSVTAFAGTGDFLVPVLLRSDQSLHRKMVLPAGGRGAIPHQRHHFLADGIRLHQCPG